MIVYELYMNLKGWSTIESGFSPTVDNCVALTFNFNITSSSNFVYAIEVSKFRIQIGGQFSMAMVTNRSYMCM